MQIVWICADASVGSCARLKISNGGVTEGGEVQAGTGEEAVVEAGPELHPPEPGLHQRGDLAEVAFMGPSISARTPPVSRPVPPAPHRERSHAVAKPAPGTPPQAILETRNRHRIRSRTVTPTSTSPCLGAELTGKAQEPSCQSWRTMQAPSTAGKRVMRSLRRYYARSSRGALMSARLATTR